MNKPNKVRYNLKNVHYAVLAEDSEGAVSFGTPKHIPGAVSLSLSAEGETSPFFADGIKYFVSVANNGYSGDLEMALIPRDFRKDVLGATEDPTAHVLVENANDKVKQFALLFEFDGDAHGTRHALYNCTATRPGVDAATTTESKEPATEALSFEAAPLASGLIKSNTEADTTESVYENWFKSVWQPGQTTEG